MVEVDVSINVMFGLDFRGFTAGGLKFPDTGIRSTSPIHNVDSSVVDILSSFADVALFLRLRSPLCAGPTTCLALSAPSPPINPPPRPHETPSPPINPIPPYQSCSPRGLKMHLGMTLANDNFFGGTGTANTGNGPTQVVGFPSEPFDAMPDVN